MTVFSCTFYMEVATPNKPDAVNPAMTLWLTIEDQWRRVTDLERWADRASGAIKSRRGA